jgi:hypothetical protein
LSASKSEEVSESRMMVEAPIESTKFEELRYESSNVFSINIIYSFMIFLIDLLVGTKVYPVIRLMVSVIL